MMSTQEPEISFLCPTVTSRHYIAKGPSGWVETFDRKKLDKELEAYAEPVGVEELIGTFLLVRKQSNEPADWWSVVGFLARMKSCHPNMVPKTVAIAFWGQVVLAIMLPAGVN